MDFFSGSVDRHRERQAHHHRLVTPLLAVEAMIPAFERERFLDDFLASDKSVVFFLRFFPCHVYDSVAF